MRPDANDQGKEIALGLMKTGGVSRYAPMPTAFFGALFYWFLRRDSYSAASAGIGS
jgi:hypothetical protein